MSRTDCELSSPWTVEWLKKRRPLWCRDDWIDCALRRSRTPAQQRIPAVMTFIFARNKSRLQIIALAVLLCALAGCGNPTIVGKWQTSSDPSPMVWEFSKNGSVLIGNVRGRYRFGDQNRVKIETPFATSVYQMEISADRMTLREANGSKLDFTRVR
jgi:hypothetical protein